MRLFVYKEYAQTNTPISMIWIHLPVQEADPLSLTSWDRVFFHICLDFSESNLWILMKNQPCSGGHTYLWVCAIWFWSKWKSGSSEFKCGFLRGLLGLGGGVHSTEYNFSLKRLRLHYGEMNGSPPNKINICEYLMEVWKPGLFLWL